MLSTKIRSTIIALVASSSLAVATVAPAVSQATAKKSPSTEVTCDGFKPGTVISTTHTVRVNGKVVTEFTTSEKCGTDGKWHKA